MGWYPCECCGNCIDCQCKAATQCVSIAMLSDVGCNSICIRSGTTYIFKKFAYNCDWFLCSGGGGNSCANAGGSTSVQLIQTNCKLQFTISMGNGQTAVYERNLDTWDCTVTQSLSKVSGDPNCTWPASVNVVPNDCSSCSPSCNFCGGLPSTLHLTFTRVSGGPCALLDGQTLAYTFADPVPGSDTACPTATSGWYHSFTTGPCASGPGCTVLSILYCVNTSHDPTNPAYSFTLEECQPGVVGGVVTGNTTSITCGPLNITFTGILVSPSCGGQGLCSDCNAQGTYNVTVTV